MKKIYSLILVLFLSGCTISTPFKGPGYESGKVILPVNNNQVIVGLTYVETDNVKEKNSIFWEHVMNVYNSMDTHSGLIGYSIRRQLLGNEAWTMSMWKNEANLDNFVRSKEHQEAIQKGLSALKKMRFARLTSNVGVVPLEWNDVEFILKEQGRGCQLKRCIF